MLAAFFCDLFGPIVDANLATDQATHKTLGFARLDGMNRCSLTSTRRFAFITFQTTQSYDAVLRYVEQVRPLPVNHRIASLDLTTARTYFQKHSPQGLPSPAAPSAHCA